MSVKHKQKIKYGLVFELVAIKAKHQFFSFAKTQLFDTVKLKEFCDIMHFSYTHLMEQSLGVDTGKFLSVKINQNVVTGVQQWLHLIYPLSVFLKKLRKPDLSGLVFQKNYTSQKYVLFVPVTAPTRYKCVNELFVGYKDLFLFFLTSYSSTLQPSYFLYNDFSDTQTSIIIPLLDAKFIFDNLRAFNLSAKVFFFLIIFKNLYSPVFADLKINVTS